MCSDVSQEGAGKPAMYKGVRKIFARYWEAYGGSSTLVRSPYLHLAALLLALTWGTWSAPFWWDQVLAVVPNVLGFTLGGFAMFLGFGDEKFRAMLAEPDEGAPAKPSIYVSLCAAFVHFIVVQVIALLLALLAKSWWFPFPWPDWAAEWLSWLNLAGGAIGYGMFLYAATSVLAATMSVFRVATWYEWHQRRNADAANDEQSAGQ